MTKSKSGSACRRLPDVKFLAQAVKLLRDLLEKKEIEGRVSGELGLLEDSDRLNKMTYRKTDSLPCSTGSLRHHNPRGSRGCQA